MTDHAIIRLRPREGRRVRAGAPWAFSNEIVMDAAAKALKPGALVDLADEKGVVLGSGYFNPKSLIAVRLLGAQGERVDADFFAGRFLAALNLRQRFYDKPFYRLVHAEGDFCPGLTVDRFGDVVSVQISTAGMENLIDPIVEGLTRALAPKTIILKNDAQARSLEGLDSYVRAAKGEMLERLVVEENGVRYAAGIESGQKSGWYYDQRDNRAFMAKLAKDARVLDVYCYAGGFGVLAAARGARQATLIDSSEEALLLAGESAKLNGVEKLCRTQRGEAFAQLERLAASGDLFDIVVCDPPPFVRARKDLESGARAYRKLARMGAAVTAHGGFLLLASCSHNIAMDRFQFECAMGITRGGRKAALIHASGAGADHPVHPHLPESAYLKALVYALD